MIKRNIASEIRYYELVQQKSIKCDTSLTQAEKNARDIAFKAAPTLSIFDGWMWDICWNAAKVYYTKKDNNNVY